MAGGYQQFYHSEEPDDRKKNQNKQFKKGIGISTRGLQKLNYLARRYGIPMQDMRQRLRMSGIDINDFNIDKLIQYSESNHALFWQKMQELKAGLIITFPEWEDDTEEDENSESAWDD